MHIPTWFLQVPMNMLNLGRVWRASWKKIGRRLRERVELLENLNGEEQKFSTPDGDEGG